MKENEKKDSLSKGVELSLIFFLRTLQSILYESSKCFIK